MPVPFFALMLVMGVLYIVFAFVTPPVAIQGLFRVPRIFGFLPDNLVIRVGRTAVGVLIIGVMLSLAVRTHSFGL